MPLDSSMLFRPNEQALLEPPTRAREHARELTGHLTKLGLRATDAPNIGTPAGVMTVMAQRVDVHPYVGRLVVLLPGPRPTDGLFWHWQRPLPGHQQIGARWFQAFCPATEPDRAARAIVAAIDAQVRARARLMHIPAAQTQGDGDLEKQLLTRTGRPLHLLVYRILALLDSVEKEVEDTVLLHQLFQIDHLATRTLRGLERLAVLGGATARQMNAPLQLATVMRQAVAQIEHYRRVRVQVPPADVAADLPGYAGPEITLLLAELVENATRFSPPDSQVQMAAVPAPSGVRIEITDQGPLPMPARTYAALNRLLADPDTITLREQITAGPIGLLVASRIAQRHGIQVTLSPVEPEGTRAVVALPSTLLTAPQPQKTRLPASPDRPPSHRAAASLPSPAASLPPPPPAPAFQPIDAESGASTDHEGLPALPRRRRARKEDGSHTAPTPTSGPGQQVRPAQQPSRLPGPSAGLLSDFADAARPHIRAAYPADQTDPATTEFDHGDSS